MSSAMLLLLLPLFTYTYADLFVSIGVLEPDPDLQLQTEAAVRTALNDAALNDEEGQEPVNAQIDRGSAEPLEPYTLPHQLCQLADRGVSVVISGAEGAGAAAVKAAAARAGVPLLMTKDPEPAPGVLSLAPHPNQIAQAAFDLIQDWKAAVLLSANGLSVGARIAEASELAARALPEEDAMMIQELLLLKVAGERRMILSAEAQATAVVLDAAQRAGMLDGKREYLLLDPDAHTANLMPFSYAGSNITALRLFDLDSKMAKRVLEAWQEEYSGQPEDETAKRDASEVAAKLARSPPTALLAAADAASLALLALRHLQLPSMTAANCESGAAAFHADTLINYLRSMEWPGASGIIRWGDDGARQAERFVVTELFPDGKLTPVGRWLAGDLQWTRPAQPERPHPPGFMRNRTFTVLIAQNDPYVMRREEKKRLSGNDQYEGFCIELIQRLGEQLGFNYTFIEQEDGIYGSYNPQTKQWSGMIKRLMEEPDIDFAITDLTITAERERAVDFTTPFMNLGIGILFSTALPPEPKMFAFLLPFSNGVWVCLGLAYVVTSLVLWLVGRLCPDEWQNPHPCVVEPPALHNQFTLANALWFNLGAVLLQGSEIAPIAYGTRAVASTWWAFALVITSSYTANLATLLAKKSPNELIHNINDLLNNTYGITYGAKSDGATLAFFEQSTNPMYQEMYQNMLKYPLPNSNKEGIDRVSNRSNMYAFFMESTTIEYSIERNCNVTQVGELLNNKGYGIAMKKNSALRQAMNLALLNLQEQGVLRDMKRSWWKERNGGGACNVEEEHGSEELNMSNFFGLWLVLIVGCTLGLVVSLADLARAAYRAKAPDETYWHRFKAELRFVFQFHRSVKPVRGPLTESSSNLSSQASEGSRKTERALSEENDENEQTGEMIENGERMTTEPHMSRRASRRSSIAAAEARRRRQSRKSLASARS